MEFSRDVHAVQKLIDEATARLADISEERRTTTYTLPHVTEAANGQAVEARGSHMTAQMPEAQDSKRAGRATRALNAPAARAAEVERLQAEAVAAEERRPKGKGRPRRPHGLKLSVLKLNVRQQREQWQRKRRSRRQLRRGRKQRQESFWNTYP